jgi:hypothetical protein
MITKPNFENTPKYYHYYIDLSDQIDLLAALVHSKEQILEFKKMTSEGIKDYAYAPGKWTVAQLIRHCIDTEIIMFYRVLWAIREDLTNMPSFDEDKFANNSNISTTASLDSLFEEWLLVRNSNILLVQNTRSEAFDNEGLVNGNMIPSKALAWMVNGHGIHHLNVLNERYLNKG